MYTIGQLSQYLEALAPAYLAESYDNVGLMLGSKDWAVSKILCALDINDAVIEEAIEENVDCIITHHPFLFMPIKKLDFSSSKGGQIYKLMKHDIAVYSMHTNLDTVRGGINDWLCDLIGIKNTRSLKITYTENIYKVAVYAPRESEQAIKDVLIKENSCTTGNYKGCSFTQEGSGSFVPLEGSEPYLGTVGQFSTAKEVKIEFITLKHEVDHLIRKIKEVHPYEEMAYDIYSLENIHRQEGIGRYGDVESMPIKALIDQLKRCFNISHVRVCGEVNKSVRKIAICSGSGSQYIGDAARVADVYITGDMKFHEAQAAIDQGLTVIDVGHYPSENVAIPLIQQYLGKQCKGLEVICSKVDGEMFKIL